MRADLTANIDPRPAKTPGTGATRDEPRRRAESAAAALLLTFTAVLLLVRLSWPPGARFDAAVTRDTRSFALKHPWFVTAAGRVSFFGSLPAVSALSGLLSLRLRSSGRPRAARFVLSTQLAGALLNQLIKRLLARARPVVPDPVARAGGPSFPSGHAMNSAIWCTMAASAVLGAAPAPAPAQRSRVALIPALAAYPLFVGLSRVALGLHFISDVVGGWLLGVGWVALGTASARPWSRDRADQEAAR